MSRRRDRQSATYARERAERNARQWANLTELEREAYLRVLTRTLADEIAWYVSGYSSSAWHGGTEDGHTFTFGSGYLAVMGTDIALPDELDTELRGAVLASITRRREQKLREFIDSSEKEKTDE